MPNHSIPVSPPSASPDCKLAHNCVNNRVVSVRYRRAFCMISPVEAFIDPKYIATIEPGQPAKISLTAYDPSKYGYLLGTLTKVSADTVFREETKSSAYAVNLSIETEIYESDTIPVSTVPGMIAQVDIIRGERTILEYFWKPVAKMKDTAFRE